MNVFGKLLARDLCHGRQRIAPFCHVQQLLHGKERVSISWERDVFASTLRGPRVAPDNGLLRSIMIWVWICLVQLGTFKLLHNLSIWSLSNFLVQFFHPFVFQGDLGRRPR